MSKTKASKGSPSRCGLPIFGLLGGLVLSGCLAQQADLKQTQLELQKSHKELQSKIQEAKNQIDRIVGETRARLAERIRSLEEEQMSSLRGDIQVMDRQHMQLIQSQEDKQGKLERMIGETQARLAEANTRLEQRVRSLEEQQVPGLRGEIQATTRQATQLIRSQEDKQGKLERMIGETQARLAEANARLAERVRSLEEEQVPGLRGDIQEMTHQAMQLIRSQEDKQAGLEQFVQKLENEQKVGQAALESKFEKDLRDHTAALKQEWGSESARMSARLDEVAARLDALHTTISTLTKTIDARLDEYQKSIAAADARSTALAQQLDAQSKTANEQAVKFSHALSDFKQGLIKLGEEMKQQEHVVKQLSASLEQQTAALSKRTDALTAKVEADTKAATDHINEVNRIMTGHLNEVNKSVSSVAKAVETAGQKFAARLEEQDRRLDELSRAIGEVAKVRSESSPSGQQPSQQRASPSTLDQMVEQPKTAGEEPAAAASQSTQGGKAGPVEAASEGKSSTAHISPREVYERVLNKFKAGDLEGASQGFTAFLAEYPNSELAPNARFWLGEAYYGKKDFKRAIEAYDHVQLDYPNSEKVPAALLKKGYAYLALKDRKRASAALRQVIELYPRTPEAEKALDKLNQLKTSP